MNQVSDVRDGAILKELVQQWRAVDGPRVGDFVKMADGSVRRFTHDWGDAIQTTVAAPHPCAGDASFYFGGDFMSFSGSLDRALPKAELRDTGEQMLGRAWFFHHREMRAHNGVSVLVPCRVFEQAKQV